MSVITDRARSLLTSAKGNPFTAPRALEIVKLYNNSDEDTERTVDQEAGLFAASVANHIRVTARRHKRQQLNAASTATVDAEADSAVGDL